MLVAFWDHCHRWLLNLETRSWSHVNLLHLLLSPFGSDTIKSRIWMNHYSLLCYPSVLLHWLFSIDLLTPGQETSQDTSALGMSLRLHNEKSGQAGKVKPTWGPLQDFHCRRIAGYCSWFPNPRSTWDNCRIVPFCHILPPQAFLRGLVKTYHPWILGDAHTEILINPGGVKSPGLLRGFACGFCAGRGPSASPGELASGPRGLLICPNLSSNLTLGSIQTYPDISRLIGAIFVLVSSYISCITSFLSLRNSKEGFGGFNSPRVSL